MMRRLRVVLLILLSAACVALFDVSAFAQTPTPTVIPTPTPTPSGCNEIQEAGSDTPETYTINMGSNSGIFTFRYETYTVKDQMQIFYEGEELFNSGCVGTQGLKSTQVSYSGDSSEVTVKVSPNCAGGTGTAWEFEVVCPDPLPTPTPTATPTSTPTATPTPTPTATPTPTPPPTVTSMPTDNLGNPGENAGPQSGPGPKTPCGSPIWSVNMVNLNLYLHDVPLWYAPPIGPSVEISLSYNSQATLTQYEPFGKKWQFSYATYLVTDPGGTVTIFMPDGRRDVYAPDGSGGYTRPYRVYNTLKKLADNSFELRFPDDTTYRYGRPAGTTTNQTLLTQICDPYQQCLSFGYDATVRLTTITDAMNRVTTLTYNEAGLVSNVHDPFGRSASFTYANGALTKITDMGGYWTELAYDANVYLVSLTNPRGTWGFYVEPADEISNNPNPYPAPGGVMWDNYRITVTNPEGGKEEYYYDAYHSYYDANAVNAWYVSPRDYRPYVSPQDNNANASTPKMTYKFTAVNGKRGSIKSITSPEIRIQLPNIATVSYTYDSATGERARITTLLGTTQYTYNALGRVTTITPPKGSASQITLGYAPNNVDVTSITDSLGTVTLTYNAAHDVTSITDRMNNVTSLAYNGYGQITSLTERLNGVPIVTTYVYDAGTHLLTQVTRAGQVVAAYTYDEIGRVKTATDATGLTLTYSYNNLNHVTAIAYPDGKSVIYAYSGCCPRLIDRVTERSGAATTFEYDGLTRLVKRTDPIGAVAFGYDANGNLTSLTDQSQHVTTFGYNLDNQLVQQTYQNGDTLHWEYAFGVVRKFTNARGASIIYAYDRHGNLAVVDYGTAMHYVGFEYDAADRLIKMTDALGDWTYSYNANSDLTSVDGPWANDTITYTYDTLGRRTGLTPQGGAALTYVYDTLDRLTRVQFGKTATAPAYVYGYSGASPLVQRLTRPNGSVTTYQYNALTQLAEIANTTSAGVILTRHQLTYNSRDLRDTEQITGSAVVPLPALNAMYSIETSNAVNQLVSRTDPAQTFAYDADGNLTNGFTSPLPGGVGGGYPFTAAYDAENRLASLTFKDGKNITQTFQYTYSGDGLPAVVKRLENGVVKEETRFVRDGGLMIQERNANNAVTRQYAWGLNLGGGIGGLLNQRRSGKDYAYLYDASGNVEAVLNASQQVVAAYRYDPFGRLLAKTGTFDQPFQFSTKRADARIGMVQYEFRNYLPVIGRWMTRDPLGEAGGLNLYAFVGNNPVNWVDPWGLYRSPEWARRWLPWVPAMDLALTNFKNGNTLAGIGNAATSLVGAALVRGGITASPVVQEMACSVQMGVGVAEAAELPQGGRWLSPTEWANSVANDLLRAAKLSGIGAGAHSGQHGRPYAAAARQLQELAKDAGLLPEVRFQLVIKAQEFLMKAKEINHPGR